MRLALPPQQHCSLRSAELPLPIRRRLNALCCRLNVLCCLQTEGEVRVPMTGQCFSVASAAAASSWAPGGLLASVAGRSFNSRLGMSVPYWSPQDESRTVTDMLVADGGCLDNPSLISMLQRRPKRLVVFGNFQCPLSPSVRRPRRRLISLALSAHDLRLTIITRLTGGLESFREAADCGRHLRGPACVLRGCLRLCGVVLLAKQGTLRPPPRTPHQPTISAPPSQSLCAGADSLAFAAEYPTQVFATEDFPRVISAMQKSRAVRLRLSNLRPRRSLRYLPLRNHSHPSTPAHN